ncbi:MAG TPA: hypothetical protein VHY21_11735 [Pseudonocardiaceae bacterium]|nr:hypothetical protein [Pseudonocardiaceae bacterium]
MVVQLGAIRAVGQADPLGRQRTAGRAAVGQQPDGGRRSADHFRVGGSDDHFRVGGSDDHGLVEAWHDQ